jgi:GntR family transcriptional regulator
MEIDPQSQLPLYAQVQAALATSIADGSLVVGEQLPPENDLSERFGVSRTTIRKTVQTLVDRGLLEIRRGKGTFVAQPKITQELTHLTGFVEDMEAVGRRATARVLGTSVVAAGETVARQLAVRPGTLVVRIERVRLADGVPVSFDETYLPRDIGERVLRSDLEREPIFSVLEHTLKLPLAEAEYCLEAVSAEPEVARALGVEAGSPIFLIERTTYGPKRRPVDYEKLHYRGDQIRFVTRLARRAP